MELKKIFLLRNTSLLLNVTAFSFSLFWLSGCQQTECFVSEDCAGDWICTDTENGKRCEPEPEDDPDTLLYEKDLVDNPEEYEEPNKTPEEQEFRPLGQIDSTVYLGIKNPTEGWEAYEIQEFLIVIGADIVADGFFGSNSEEAVKDFQRSESIQDTGEIDEATIALLLDKAWKIDQIKNLPVTHNEQSSWNGLRKGRTGDAAKNLQKRLRELGFAVAHINGKLSNASGIDALKGFQIRAGTVADGIIGPKTAALLNSNMALNDLWKLPAENEVTSITIEQFIKIPNLKINRERAEVVLPYVNMILKTCGLRTETGKAMMLSQLAWETAYFSALVELPSRYASSSSNYKGRGFIQLTGLSNYTGMQKDLIIPAVNFPNMVAVLRYASMSSSWFWVSHNMGKYVASGNIEGVVRTINYYDPKRVKRKKYYKEVKKAIF